MPISQAHHLFNTLEINSNFLARGTQIKRPEGKALPNTHGKTGARALEVAGVRWGCVTDNEAPSRGFSCHLCQDHCDGGWAKERQEGMVGRERAWKPTDPSPVPSSQAETWKRNKVNHGSWWRKNAPEEGNIRTKAPQGAGAWRGPEQRAKGRDT